MSADNWTTTIALAHPTTINVLVKDLVPGDLIFLPTDASPWRVRHVDRFPGGKVNVHATPGLLLNRSTTQSIGVYDGAADFVRRVALT